VVVTRGQTTEALAIWLQQHTAPVVAPVETTRIGAGQSNITMLVRDAGGSAWILRRPPPGARDRTAHDMHREARVLRALAVTDVPVPAVVATGEDAAGIDGPFYVMQRATGVALADETDAEPLTPDERRSLGHDAVSVLATIHSVDVDDVGLGDLGPREDFLGRQIRRTVRNWAAWGEGSEEAGEWEECRRRLERRCPVQQRSVLTHGDYRLSNLLVNRGRITAVLDWELCALGDPLADVAWLLDDWRSPSEPAIAMASPTRVGGFPARATLVEEYAARTGLDLADIDRYRAFTHWKAATLLQGAVRRRRSGVLGDHGTIADKELQHAVAFLLHEALALI
jgi:aminoglycoside phosphotransferase (APT) family kinase protein